MKHTKSFLLFMNCVNYFAIDSRPECFTRKEEPSCLETVKFI